VEGVQDAIDNSDADAGGLLRGEEALLLGRGIPGDSLKEAIQRIDTDR
jgi:hypothetical protein